MADLGSADPEGAASAERARLEAALPRLADALREAGVLARGDALALVRQFEAGQSNPTYLLDAGGRHLVLRKQPNGELLPRAHDVAREHDVVQALHEAGFCVPRPLLAGRDKAVIGTDFFVMEYVAGTVHSDPALPDLAPGERAATYRALAETLARLHRIAPAALARAGVRPRPDFVARQVGVWRAAYRAAQTEPDDRIDAVGQWLVDRKPARENVGVVHGDYRVENLIFRGDAVAAVLDWELCTIGEPLADLAYCCLWYHLPSSTLRGLADRDLAALGIPDEGVFLEDYARASGLDPSASHSYFLALAFYRLAAILQGVYKRGLEGNAASSQALTRGRAADLCLARAADFAAAS